MGKEVPEHLRQSNSKKPLSKPDQGDVAHRIIGSWFWRRAKMRFCRDGTWHESTAAHKHRGRMISYLHGRYRFENGALVMETTCSRHKRNGDVHLREERPVAEGTECRLIIERITTDRIDFGSRKCYLGNTGTTLTCEDKPVYARFMASCSLG